MSNRIHIRRTLGAGWWAKTVRVKGNTGSSDAFQTVNDFVTLWTIDMKPPRARLETLDRLEIGDVIIYGSKVDGTDPNYAKFPFGYDFDHAALVVGEAGTFTPLVASRGGATKEIVNNQWTGKWTCQGGVWQYPYNSTLVDSLMGNAAEKVMGLKIDYLQY